MVNTTRPRLLLLLFGMGVRSEGSGPGDLAMAGRIDRVAAFGESPARAGVKFAESEEISGDVLIGAGEAFFGGGELIHKAEAEVLLFRGEVDLGEASSKDAGVRWGNRSGSVRWRTIQ